MTGGVPHEQYLAELLSERGEKGKGSERRRERERDEGAGGSVSSVEQLGEFVSIPFLVYVWYSVYHSVYSLY